MRAERCDNSASQERRSGGGISSGGSMGVRDAWIEKRLAETAAANGSRNVSQMHYARQGVITEEMAFVARAREDRAGTGAQRSGARPRHHPREHPSQIARAHGHRHRLQVQDQLEHRQFRDHVEHRRGAEEAAPLRALRRGHGDGPFDRRRHPRRFARPSSRLRPCRSAPCRFTKRSRA